MIVEPHVINYNLNKSDYNENIYDKTNLFVIFPPYYHQYDINRGIIYDKDNKRNAYDDTIKYCLINNIYPVNIRSIPSTLLFNVKCIYKRNIEEGWTICINENTIEINKYIYIKIIKDEKEIYIPLILLCIINEINYSDMIFNLRSELIKYYFSLFIKEDN